MKKTTLFHSRLRQLITTANVTQKQLAEAVGVKPQSVSQYLDGASSPSYAVLVDIADYFHVSTDYMLGRSDVSTDDMNISAIGKALGLSEKAVSAISANCAIAERLFGHELTKRLLETLKNYHDCTVGQTTDVYRLLADHEIREAGYLLEDIFRAGSDEKPFRKWDVQFVEGDPPPLADDEAEIVIPASVKEEEIMSFLENALLEEAQRRRE